MLENALVISLVIAGIAIFAIIALSTGLVSRSSLFDTSEEESWTEPIFYGLAIVAALAFFSWFNLRLTGTPLVLEMNVTGAIVPILVSSYLVVHVRAGWRSYLIATLAVTGLASLLTQMTVEGVHIPIISWILIVAVCAGLSYVLTHGQLRSALAVAYFSATMGMLFGGDVFQLAGSSTYYGPFVIGVGGIMDFVFLTGVMSVALIVVSHHLMEFVSSHRPAKHGS